MRNIYRHIQILDFDGLRYGYCAYDALWIVVRNVKSRRRRSSGHIPNCLDSDLPIVEPPCVGCPSIYDFQDPLTSYALSLKLLQRRDSRRIIGLHQIVGPATCAVMEHAP